MTDDFIRILEESYKQETSRLDRILPTLMPDEYRLTPDIESSLANGTYQFPDVSEVRTDKRVLTRKQDYFSAKVHVRRTPLYFHRHEFVEMLYMYRGQCLQFIENLGACITLYEGDVFLLNQNVTHALLQEDESAVLIKIIIPTGTLSQNFQLSGQQAWFWTGLGEHYHYLHYTGSTADEKLFVERMMAEYYSQSPCKEIAETSWLQLMLISLSSRVGDKRRHKLGHSSVNMGRITEYVYEHSETVTLEELARVFSFSPSYLSRLIKEGCGMNFLDLLRECRLEKAAALLTATNYPIGKIAELVGYSSAASVYQGVREKFGMSPTEYRDKYSQINREHTTNE
ncbi:AraC family transcriptional regulator [Acutalibacter muris]|uniref:AraC family transcriptional regulator n=1 Tax=Acutalibacter muris TaxID=1796620 RepID=UPI001C3EE6B6|nr:AraC family transcriptional regulator [Acutalibacter muris]